MLSHFPADEPMQMDTRGRTPALQRLKRGFLPLQKSVVLLTVPEVLGGLGLQSGRSIRHFIAPAFARVQPCGWVACGQSNMWLLFHYPDATHETAIYADQLGWFVGSM